MSKVRPKTAVDFKELAAFQSDDARSQCVKRNARGAGRKHGKMGTILDDEDTVEAQALSTSLDPYGQLIKMLMPRAMCIAIYDRMGQPAVAFGRLRWP